jgi:glycosyltransferase involved in cell wall biosynthesis
MISVLFAIPELDRGGPDRVVFEIIEHLDRMRFEPRVLLSSDTGYYRQKLRRDISVTVVPGRYPVISALRHIRRTKPDIVFATQRMILTLGLAAPLFPRRTRFVVRQANDLSADWATLIGQSIVKHRAARQMTVSALQRADAVVCQSEAMRTDLTHQLRGRGRLHVIFNPIDVRRVEGVVRAKPRGNPALVSMGRLMPQKGFDVLLAAFARIHAGHPDAHLTIYGDGPDRSALEAQSQALGLTNAVTFAGFTSDPLAALAGADLFVLASRYEGFPNAALEALACGTPVVLTDCPGANAEIIEPGLNGRLADAVDGEAVAKAIELALAEQSSYDASRIQSRCAERFSAERIVRQYEDVLTQVAS